MLVARNGLPVLVNGPHHLALRIMFTNFSKTFMTLHTNKNPRGGWHQWWCIFRRHRLSGRLSGDRLAHLLIYQRGSKRESDSDAHFLVEHVSLQKCLVGIFLVAWRYGLWGWYRHRGSHGHGRWYGRWGSISVRRDGHSDSYHRYCNRYVRDSWHPPCFSSTILVDGFIDFVLATCLFRFAAHSPRSTTLARPSTIGL